MTRRSGDSLGTHWPFLAGSSRQGGGGSRAAGPFHFRTGPAVSFEMLRTEAEGVGLTLTRERLLDSARCFPSRHGLGVVWNTRRGPSSRAVGAHSNRPLLGQHGAVAQSEVAGDALVDAAELIGTLRCCPGNTPERLGSLPIIPCFPSEIAFCWA